MEIPREAAERLKPNGSRVVDVYEYRYPDGKLAFCNIRLIDAEGRRDFRPITQVNGVFRLVKGDRPEAGFPLYGLHTLSRPGAIWVTEGEKDAKNLAALGLSAVTSGSSSTAEGADWSPLAGREVIIWPDHDTPGQQYADKVAAKLRLLGCTIERIKVDALGLSKGGDASDWLALNQGAKADDVLKLEREKYVPPVPKSRSLNSPRLQEPAFYGLAGEVVRTIAPYSEVDDAALLTQFLAAFGNVVGPNPYCRVESSLHAFNLFVVLVGATSKGRKGTSWGHIKDLMSRVDPAWVENRVTDGLSSAEGLISEVRDQEPPTDRRLQIVQGEFASVLRVMARDGNTLSSTLRNAWDGGNMRTLVKNSPLKATNAHISIVGHVTSTELLKYLSDTEAHNGFANRFLFVSVSRSKLLPEGGRVPESELDQLAKKISAAVSFLHGEQRPFFQRDDDARALWAVVYPKLSEGLPGLLGAATSRAEPQVLRLSAIYAALDSTTTVRVEHLRAALAVWDYCFQSARLIFGDALGDVLADKILRELTTAGDIGLTRTEMRDLFKRNPCSSRDRSRAQPPRRAWAGCM